MHDERGELITVTEAMAILGCSRGGVCKILRQHLDRATGLSAGGRIEGRQFSPRLWMVYRQSVEAAKATGMSWCAGLKRGDRKPGGAKRRRAS